MKQTGFLHGGAFILLLLVILALSDFGLLALLTARSDYRLAQKNAEAIQRYYALDAEAHRLTARLSDALAPPEAAGDAAARAAALGWTLLEGEPPAVERTIAGEGSSLLVRLALTPQAGGKGLEVLAWRLENDPFAYPDGQNVWTGEEE